MTEQTYRDKQRHTVVVGRQALVSVAVDSGQAVAGTLGDDHMALGIAIVEGKECAALGAVEMGAAGDLQVVRRVLEEEQQVTI
jgi:hypothetical protein